MPLQILMGGALYEMLSIFVHTHCRNILKIRICLHTLSMENAMSRLTTFSDGCLGSSNDEGRSEVR